MKNYSEEKMINLNLGEDFSSDLKFKVNLPDPTPETKFLYLPKNQQNLFTPKITFLNIYQKTQIFSTPNFGIDMIRIHEFHNTKEDKESLDDLEKKILGLKNKRKYSEISNDGRTSVSVSRNVTPNRKDVF